MAGATPCPRGLQRAPLAVSCRLTAGRREQALSCRAEENCREQKPSQSLGRDKPGEAISKRPPNQTHSFYVSPTFEGFSLRTRMRGGSELNLPWAAWQEGRWGGPEPCPRPVLAVPTALSPPQEGSNTALRTLKAGGPPHRERPIINTRDKRLVKLLPPGSRVAWPPRVPMRTNPFAL